MMTDREKHLSLALDALVQATETLDTYADDLPDYCYHFTREMVRQARASIEAAAMAKPSVLRRWFGRKEAA